MSLSFSIFICNNAIIDPYTVTLFNKIATNKQNYTDTYTNNDHRNAMKKIIPFVIKCRNSIAVKYVNNIELLMLYGLQLEVRLLVGWWYEVYLDEATIDFTIHPDIPNSNNCNSAIIKIHYNKNNMFTIDIIVTKIPDDPGWMHKQTFIFEYFTMDTLKTIARTLISYLDELSFFKGHGKISPYTV